MAGYRIFVADPEAVAPGLRLRERIEAVFMDDLYEQPPPRCDLPDRGTLQLRRRADEPEVVVRSRCDAVGYGLPASLAV